MTLWNRLFGRTAAANEAARASMQPIGGGRVITTLEDLQQALSGNVMSSAGARVTAESSMAVSAVFACVRIISGAIATMPLNVVERIDGNIRRDADQHPLWALLRRRPNRWMTPSAFRRLLTAHAVMRGNGYALIVRSGKKVIELIPMHPDRVIVEQLDDLSLVYTYTRRNGSRVTLPQRDVLHLTGLSLDGIRGISVLHYAREAVGLAIQTEKLGSKVFSNGAHIGQTLEHPGSLSKEALERLRSSLDAYRGAENAHQSLILEEGMKLTPIGMTSEDAQYIEMRKFTRSEIAMFFGVPPHMIGDTEKSTSWGTGIEQQSLGFVAYTLQDWLTAWEETIARDLIGEDEPRIFARFNTAGLVRGDLKARVEAYEIARRTGWLSPNDIRAKEDMNPIPGGDSYIEPLNMAPLSKGTQP